MSSTNLGNQVIPFAYGTAVNSSIFNTRLVSVIKTGVYDGGLLSVNGTVLTISSFVIEVLTPTGQQVRVTTKNNINSDFSLPVSESNPIGATNFDAAHPFIVASFVWSGTSSDYLNFNAKSSAQILPTDIVFGSVTFVGPQPIISYSQKTFGLIDNGGNIYSNSVLIATDQEVPSQNAPSIGLVLTNETNGDVSKATLNTQPIYISFSYSPSSGSIANINGSILTISGVLQGEVDSYTTYYNAQLSTMAGEISNISGTLQGEILSYCYYYSGQLTLLSGTIEAINNELSGVITQGYSLVPSLNYNAVLLDTLTDIIYETVIPALSSGTIVSEVQYITTGNYSVGAGITTVICKPATSGIIITLPDATTNNKRYISVLRDVNEINSGIIIVNSISGSISYFNTQSLTTGYSNYVMSYPYETFQVRSNGTDWVVFNRDNLNREVGSSVIDASNPLPILTYLVPIMSGNISATGQAFVDAASSEPANAWKLFDRNYSTQVQVNY